MDKFSKRINNSEKSFYSLIERMNPKYNQRSFIPNTNQFISPHQKVATSHLPTLQPNQKTSQLLWPAEIIMSSSPENPSIFPINASTLSPHHLWKNLSLVPTSSHMKKINNDNIYNI